MGKAVPVSVSFDEGIWEELKTLAAAEGRSASSLLNEMAQQRLRLGSDCMGELLEGIRYLVARGRQLDAVYEAKKGGVVQNAPESVVGGEPGYGEIVKGGEGEGVECGSDGRPAVPDALKKLPTLGEMKAAQAGRPVEVPRGAAQIPPRPQDSGMRVKDVAKKGSSSGDPDFYEDGDAFPEEAPIDIWECAPGVAGLSDEAFEALVLARDGKCRVEGAAVRHGGELRVLYVEDRGRNSRNVVSVCEKCFKALERARAAGALKKSWGELGEIALEKVPVKEEETVED